MPKKYDAQTRARAIRLVTEHRDDYPSEHDAIRTVAGRLGMNPETLPSGCVRPSRRWRCPGHHHGGGAGDP